MKKMSKVIFCMIFCMFQTAEMYSYLRVTYEVPCRNPDNVENLNMQKMLGTWYIIKESDTTGLCSSLNFKEKFNQISVEKCLFKFKHRVTCFDFANLTVSDRISAQIDRDILYWDDGNPFNFNVITTDYDTYAGIYFCKNSSFKFAPISASQSIMILSRKKLLDQEHVNKITSKFTEFEMKSDELWDNDQRHCPSTFNLTCNRNKYNFLGSLFNKFINNNN